jgi:flagellar hook-basal body complex protein FliE
MNIDPVRLQMLSNLTGATRTSPLNSTQTSFENLVQNSLAQIAEAESTVRGDTVKLAMGSNGDSLHTVTIDAAKADLAVQTMVSVRNKALDAYNEIMRITL